MGSVLYATDVRYIGYIGTPTVKPILPMALDPTARPHMHEMRCRWLLCPHCCLHERELAPAASLTPLSGDAASSVPVVQQKLW